MKTSPSTSESSATVLVAEDSGLLAALLKDALRAHGLGEDVRVYPDGRAFVTGVCEGLDQGRRARLLVIDIALPVLDGLSAAREIREAERSRSLPPAPIVFFSSREEDEEIAIAIAECFPARFVQKNDEGGPAVVVLEGVRLMREMLAGAGR